MAAINLNKEQFQQMAEGGQAHPGGFLGSLVRLLPPDRARV